MEALKQYIIDFSNKNGKYASMCIINVAKALNIDEDTLDVMLRKLVADEFIICSLPADNKIYEFYLNQ
ncbi:hypothetical protein FMM68_09860 [Lachnospiraceae bacterium MD329]|nr:hypothetical protein [Lachnospiraceae bacterium MD329]